MRGFFAWAVRTAKSAFAVSATLWVIGATAFLLIKETRVFLADFVAYAVISLASEAFFTGITTQIRRVRRKEPIDWRLPCQPFLWSIFVYGLSAALSFRLIEMWFPSFFGWPWYLRGVAYMTCIYLWEYFWGWRIEALTGSCPWKYRESPWKIWRYVNPYFFWSWYCFGFVLEFIHVRIVPMLPGIR